jgi:cell division protein FtsQ
VDKIKQSILQLPWVYAVSINRVWPNKLVIKITEQQAMARWNNNALLNSNADIFIPNAADLPNDLPNLFGPNDQAEEVWHSYQEMNQAIKNLGLDITGLGLNSQGCSRLVLNNGINVILGNEAIMKRFYEFIKVYPKIIGVNGKNVANVDLRYSNGLAIKWKHIKK